MTENKPLIGTEYDWVEDFNLENGFYTRICIECKTKFTGYKRRVICKKCHIRLIQEHVEQLEVEIRALKKIRMANFEFDMQTLQQEKEINKILKRGEGTK